MSDLKQDDTLHNTATDGKLLPVELHTHGAFKHTGADALTRTADSCLTDSNPGLITMLFPRAAHVFGISDDESLEGVTNYGETGLRNIVFASVAALFLDAKKHEVDIASVAINAVCEQSSSFRLQSVRRNVGNALSV